MRRSYALLSPVLFSFATGCGPDEATRLVDTSAEPAGANCAQGGVRIDVGLDRDDDGMLATDEVDSSEYVCNGSNGTNGTTSTGDKIKLSNEAAGANCSFGGTRIDVGPDTDNNGTLDTGEITTTRYVCNSGAGDVVTAFTEDLLAMDDQADATAQTASVVVPAAGTVFAIADLDAYCTSTTGQATSCQTGGTPASDLCIRITTDAAATGCWFATAPQTFTHLAANTTEHLTFTTAVAVTPGTATFHIRASTRDAASTGKVGMWRRSLTLIYVPDAPVAPLP